MSEQMLKVEFVTDMTLKELNKLLEDNRVRISEISIKVIRPQD